MRPPKLYCRGFYMIAETLIHLGLDRTHRYDEEEQKYEREAEPSVTALKNTYNQWGERITHVAKIALITSVALIAIEVCVAATAASLAIKFSAVYLGYELLQMGLQLEHLSYTDLEERPLVILTAEIVDEKDASEKLMKFALKTSPLFNMVYSKFN